MDFASEARIEVSTLCNHKCIFCTHPYLKRKKQVMSNDLYTSIIDRIQKEPSITQITFSGIGEIFTDKELIWKMEYAKNKGYEINLLTNGTLLDEEKVDKLFDLEVKNFRISIHSTNKEHFTEITQVNERLFDKLISIVDYISTKRNKKTKFIINAVIDNPNKGDVDKLISDIGNKVDILEVWKPHNWADSMHYRDGNKFKKTCGRPYRSPLQVQVDGTVIVCCFDSHGDLEIGDLKSQSIKEIFSSPLYYKILNAHETESFDGLICKNCDQRIEFDGLIYSSVKKSIQERENLFSSTFNPINND